MELKDLNLKNNPFRLTPPLNPDEIIWVDFEELKIKLEERIKISIKTTPSSIVLNWGSYGIGKTHAALYFSRTKRLEELANELKTKAPKCVKVNLPRTSKDPVQAFLRAFLGQVKSESIKKDFSELKNIFKGDLEKILESISSDNIISKLFNKIIETDKAEDLLKIEDYLYGDSKKSLLGSLELPFGLQDDEQVVNFLSTYINAITFDKKLFSAFFLWIDEFEDIDVLTKSNQERFTTFMRQLIDKTSNNFTLFLNFSPKPFSTLEDLSRILGEALATRIRAQINFEEPTVDQASLYIKELLNHPLFRNKPSEDDFQPFNNESVNFILSHLKRRTVRIINETFSLLIELALMDKKSVIDTDFVKSKKDELIMWEEEKI